MSKLSQWSWIKWSWVLSFSVCVGLVLLLTISPARASFESRLSNLEADLYKLERQIDRLETDVRRSSRDLNRESHSGRSNAAETPSLPDSDVSALADDPMFDRLATLVIELKLRLDGFEERLDEIELHNR